MIKFESLFAVSGRNKKHQNSGTYTSNNYYTVGQQSEGSIIRGFNPSPNLTLTLSLTLNLTVG